MSWEDNIIEEMQINDKLNLYKAELLIINKDYYKIINDLENEIKIKKIERDDKLNCIQNNISKIKCEIIERHLPFKVGDFIHYRCKGSGYYGIFKGIEEGQVVMDVCSKGGIPKNYQFRCYLDNNYWYFQKIKDGDE